MAIGPHTFATLVFRNLRLPPFFQRPHIGFCSAIVDPTTDGARFQLGFRMARSETSFFTNCRFASTWSDSLVKVAEVTVRVEFYRHLDLGSVSSRAVGIDVFVGYLGNRGRIGFGLVASKFFCRRAGGI